MSNAALATNEGYGPYLQVVLEVYDIQKRELAHASGIHESEISRVCKERKIADFKFVHKTGVALGTLIAQRAKK